ncbi:hypothetical protein DL95DRAFT_443470 [Leptodontidium sp. 2 PMI_412]|nr:hypothetical protein DL95DRAFT_443470 [Leptodontidium sp. 2 PMI_412]
MAFSLGAEWSNQRQGCDKSNLVSPATQHKPQHRDQPRSHHILNSHKTEAGGQQEAIEGVFNKSCMISYPNYKFIFPMKALGPGVPEWHSITRIFYMKFEFESSIFNLDPSQLKPDSSRDSRLFRLA